MKKYEVVAYSTQQYAPALCLWREEEEIDAVRYGIEDYILVGYMDDAGQPDGTPRRHKIYYGIKSTYIVFRGHRYRLDSFLQF